MNKSRMRYSLAVASAATLASLSCGGLMVAAAADPGAHHGHGNGPATGHDNRHDKGEGKGHGKGKGKGHGNGNGHDDGGGNGPATGHGGGNGGGNANGHGNGGGNEHAPGHQAQHGDPPGNNGTVKIAAPSDAVGHPSNNPHPGCTVVVEWFGFDEGADVVSTVGFAAQAPTSDAVVGGTSPVNVFVGGDPASGGTDLDGRQAYPLTFEGEPHPQQGFHVKLTVTTPHSLGNDTKTKVFWVEPCAPSPLTAEPEEGVEPGEEPGEGQEEEQGASSQSSSTSEESSSGVLGTSAEAEESTSSSATGSAADAAAAVPTAVDAGENASALPDWTRSPLPIAVVAGGLVLVAAGVAHRSRRGA